MPLDNIQEFMTLHVKIHQVLIFQRPLPLSIYLITFGFWVQFKPAETLKNIPAIFLQLCLLRAMKWKHKGRELPWHQLLCMHVFIGGEIGSFDQGYFYQSLSVRDHGGLKKGVLAFLGFFFVQSYWIKIIKKWFLSVQETRIFFFFDNISETSWK